MKSIILPISLIEKSIFGIILIYKLVYSPPRFFAFHELPLIMRGYSPTMLQVVLEVSFIDNLSIQIVFDPESASLTLHELPLKDLIAMLVVNFSHTIVLRDLPKSPMGN